MPAIKSHKTSMDKTGAWDGPKAVADAPNDAATLRHMHAWYAGSEPEKKASYKFPHHESGTDTPAVNAGVNNALARLAQAKIPQEDRAGVETHLRKHRKDAGMEESMSEAEIAEAVKFIRKMDDLKAEEARPLAEAIRLQEKANLGEWADGMFGDGMMTRGAGQVSMAESVIELVESAVPLTEKAVRKDGTALLKIIQPGWGSSGYYSKEMLQRDGPKAFPKGTKNYWNHPTPTEEAERPEGDLNNLASEQISDARWMDNGPEGPGLYADSKVFEGYQSAVNDLAPHIGVSINARGKWSPGKAEGKEGAIIEELLASQFNHVDYVTMPGAGGKIVSLFEAARVVRADKKATPGTVPGAAATLNVAISESTKENEMEMKELQEAVATLQTQNETLAASNARLNQALALRDARDMARETLSQISLPDATKARVVETLAKNPPMKDGALDREAFATSILEAVKTESAYLEKVVGLGNIRGLGESANDDQELDEDKLEGELAESFRAIGLSEAGAKIAAKGRV